MLPLTSSCIASRGKTIIGKDNESKRFIGKINSVDKLFCDIITRIRISKNVLSDYCNINSSSIDISSSSSSDCCPLEIKTEIPEYNYLINVTDLDDDAYELIASLEQEACATLVKIRQFEILNVNCNSSSSSEFSSSGDSSSSSSSDDDSSSSSEEESSSESSSSSFPYEFSSSSEEENTAPPVVYLASYCDTLPLSVPLDITPPTSILHGDFEYVSWVYSSTSEGIGLARVRFILATSTWEIFTEIEGVIAQMTGSNEINPRGVYTYILGGCEGESIFVI